jgi:hypothetical protein
VEDGAGGEGRLEGLVDQAAGGVRVLGVENADKVIPRRGLQGSGLALGDDHGGDHGRIKSVVLGLLGRDPLSEPGLEAAVAEDGG